MSKEFSELQISNEKFIVKDRQARSDIEQIKTKNVEQDSKIKSLASGSPLKASSINEMTDISKIYVNTIDGNWYFYDGVSWNIGGVYQAVEVDEGSITPEKTSFMKRQETNKIGFKNGNKTIDGLTVELNEDGTVKIYGNPTEKVVIDITEFVQHDIKGGKTYTTTFENISGSKDDVNFQLITKISNDQSLTDTFINIRNTPTLTIETQFTPDTFKFSCNPGNYNDYKFKIWINEGEQKPYVNYHELSFKNLEIPGLETIKTTIENIEKSGGINVNNFLKTSGTKPLISLVDDDTSSVESIEKIETICEELNIKATFGCKATNIDSTSENYSSDLLNKLKTLQRKGYHITSHSYSHSRFWSINDETYNIEKCEEDLVKSLEILKQNNFFNSDYIVTPYGTHNDDVKKIATRNCKALINANYNYGSTLYPANHLYDKGRYDIDRLFVTGTLETSGTEFETVLTKYKNIIDQVYENGDWLVLGSHSGINTEFNETLLKAVLQYAINKGIEVKNFHEAYKQRKYNYEVQEIFN